MNKLLAEYCDIILKHAFDHPDMPVTYTNTSVKGLITPDNWKKGVDYIMANHNYLDPHPDHAYVVKINSFGKAFIHSGQSFLQLWENNLKDAEKNRARQIKEDEKLDTDLTLAKWQKRIFWPVFIGGVIGGICGVISLIMQLTGK